MAFLKNLFKTKETQQKRPYTSAVIVASGTSSRMDGIDKMSALLAGIPVIAHSISAFEANSLIDEIIVVTRPELIAEIGSMCKTYLLSKVKCIIRGGQTRKESVLQGLMEVSDDTEFIAVHDGARPLVSQDIISNAVRAAWKYECAIPAVKVSDTIKIASGGTVKRTPDREEMYGAQTPQVFRAELIKAALTRAIEKKIDITDDSMAVELLGANVRLVEGSSDNIKITYPIDLYTAQCVIENRTFYAE